MLGDVIVDNAQQCFAVTPQANFPAHNMNFLWVKMMGLNLGYLLKSFLLYAKLGWFLPKSDQVQRKFFELEECKGDKIEWFKNWMNLENLNLTIFVTSAFLHLIFFLISKFCIDTQNWYTTTKVILRWCGAGRGDAPSLIYHGLLDFIWAWKLC